MGDLTELEQALIAFSEAEKQPSTARQISKISSTIEHVIADGLNLDLVVSFLNQKGINISKNTLKVTLYRLRKKEKNAQKAKEATRQIPSQHPPSETPAAGSVTDIQLRNERTRAELVGKMEAFNKAVGWQERFLALGGNRDDIIGKPASQQRHMAMHLKSKVERELRDYE